MSEPMRRPRVGEIIVYHLFGGAMRQCRVTAVFDDVKNGRPGFDAVATGDMECWGYDDQIVEYPRISEVGVE